MNAQSYVDHYSLAKEFAAEIAAHSRAIASAPDKATRAAKQNAARDFARLVHNSRIIPILKAAHDPSSVIKFDPFALESRLKELDRDCVPGVNGVSRAVPDDGARLSAIENQLQILAGHVSRLPNADENNRKKKHSPDPYKRYLSRIEADRVYKINISPKS